PGPSRCAACRALLSVGVSVLEGPAYVVARGVRAGRVAPWGARSPLHGRGRCGRVLGCLKLMTTAAAEQDRIRAVPRGSTPGSGFVRRAGWRGIGRGVCAWTGGVVLPWGVGFLSRSRRRRDGGGSRAPCGRGRAGAGAGDRGARGGARPGGPGPGRSRAEGTGRVRHGALGAAVGGDGLRHRALSGG